MKTLIAYASKYGTTEKCADTLKSKLPGEVVLLDLNKAKAPDFAGFDQIIVGSSVYIGQIQKAVKAFVTEHIQTLKNKPFGIYICSGFPENIDKVLEMGMPKELVENTKAISAFGGELQLDKMRGMDKFMTKMMTASAVKESKKLPELDFAKIEAFAKQFA